MNYSPQLHASLHSFVDGVIGTQADKRIRHMLIEYMKTEDAKTHPDTNELLIDLKFVFDLLDAIKDEGAKHKVTPRG